MAATATIILIKMRVRVSELMRSLLSNTKALIIESGKNKYQNAKKPNVVTDMNKTIIVQVIKIVRSEVCVFIFCFFIILVTILK
jgi:hypothetical protein